MLVLLEPVVGHKECLNLSSISRNEISYPVFIYLRDTQHSQSVSSLNLFLSPQPPAGLAEFWRRYNALCFPTASLTLFFGGGSLGTIF